MIPPTAPDGTECDRNHCYALSDGRRAMACWYPQMGGYTSKCVVVWGPGDECFEAYVWHDGEFAFADDAAPTQIHHCSANQFIRFGENVKKAQGGTP